MSTPPGSPAQLLCPSAPCKVGNQLLGAVGRDGRVEFFGQPVTMDERFVSLARLGRPPEQRFRFATPCVSKGCAHWKDQRCGVSDEVVATLGTGSAAAVLPACGIRGSCRWFAQSGAQACAVCTDVVREIRTAPDAVAPPRPTG